MSKSNKKVIKLLHKQENIMGVAVWKLEELKDGTYRFTDYWGRVAEFGFDKPETDKALTKAILND